jgi:hypothetical protein
MLLSTGTIKKENVTQNLDQRVANLELKLQELEELIRANYSTVKSSCNENRSTEMSEDRSQYVDDVHVLSELKK